MPGRRAILAAALAGLALLPAQARAGLDYRLVAADKPARGGAGQAEFDEGARLYEARNHVAAARLFLRAAEMGHARAQLQIGYQYNQGEGVPLNYAEAVKWYGRSAAQGDATAQSNLGDMYEGGRGVREDWVEAARWYRASAEQDHASGQFRLGRAYQFGIGVPQNRKLAVQWFQKAGFQGHPQARYFAQRLLSRGTFVGFRDEQEEAQVVAGKLRAGLLWEEPVGMLFHNSADRLAHIKNLRHRVDRYETYQAWVGRRNDHDECMQLKKSPCADPGPAPQ